MNYARCKVCRKCVVVALVQGKVSEFSVLNDVLIEEAVQCPTLCNIQCVKVAIRVRIVLSN